jgi:hypothetical protein
LVYWNKSAKEVAEIEKREDDDFSPNTGEIEYSRAIDVADAKDIDRYYKEFGGPKPPEITHQAIADIAVEKASDIFYFDGKKWWQLQGSD